MNRKLLTSIVGASLLAGPGMAMADVKVGGNLHVSQDRIENDGSGGTKGSFQSSNFSYLNIKGDQEIREGLSSIFQIRAPLRADDGSNGLGNTLYDTFVGLKGGFGSVRAGRMDAPVKDLAAVVNLFGTRVGDARNVIGQVGSTQSAATELNARYSDSIRYDSPKFGGFDAAALYSGESDALHRFSSYLRFTAGPALVALGYEKRETATDDDESATRLVGRYKFGDFTVGALYEQLKDLGGVSGADRDSAGASLKYTMGSVDLGLQWFQTSEVDTAAVDNGGSILAAGADYRLSKSTKLYVVYAVTDNDDAGAFKVSGAGAHADGSLAATAGEGQKGASLGLQITF